MIFLAVPVRNVINKAKNMLKKKIKRLKKVLWRLLKKNIQLFQIELKRLIKPYIVSLKPTITALVFLLVSSFAQQLMDKINRSDYLDNPCAVGGVLNYQAKSVELQGQTILAGSRALKITRHAAERMVERGVSKQTIGMVVNNGKLFAYNHANKIVKIGYYSTVSKVFVAVDQQHYKILTVIHNVPEKYISKLINYISKPLSLDWSADNLFSSNALHSYLATGLDGVGWFVVFMLITLLLVILAVGGVQFQNFIFRTNSVKSALLFP